jgi:hypothetical protein
MGFGYFIFFIAVAVFGGHLVKERASVLKAGAITLAAGLAVMAIVGTLAAVLNWQGVSLGINAYVQAVIDELARLYSQTGADGSYSDLIAANRDRIASFVLMLSPSIAFLYALVCVTLNLVLAMGVAKRKAPSTGAQSAVRFKLPDGLVWPVIVVGFAFFMNRYSLRNELVEAIAMNGIVVFLAVYFLQGLAVVAFAIGRFRSRFTRAIAYIAIAMFFQSVSVMIVALGLADVWMDFRVRKWRLKTN